MATQVISFASEYLAPIFGPGVSDSLIAWIISILVTSAISSASFLLSGWQNIPLKIRIYSLLANIRDIFESSATAFSGFYYARYKADILKDGVPLKNGVSKKKQTDENGNKTEVAVQPKVICEVIFLYRHMFSQKCTAYVLKRLEFNPNTNAYEEHLRFRWRSKKRFKAHYSVDGKRLSGVWTDPTEPKEVAGVLMASLQSHLKRPFKYRIHGEWFGFTKTDRKDGEKPPFDHQGHWKFWQIATNSFQCSKFLLSETSMQDQAFANFNPDEKR